MKKPFVLFLMVFILLGVWAVTIHAQDVTPDPSPIVVTAAPDPTTPALPPSIETPEDILGLVLATISGSVFVTAVVGLLKTIIPSSVASGDVLKNLVSVVVWILYSLAIKFGLGTQFQGIAAFLAPILITATPLIGVLIGSSKLYHAAKSANVPIFGYQRRE